MATGIDRKADLSGGLQSATTPILRKPNEISDGYNFTLNAFIGAISRRLGYVKEGNASTTKPTLGLHEAKFTNGAKVFHAINKSDDTETQIRYYQKSVGANWTTLSLPYTMDPNVKVQMADSISEMYIAGKVAGGARIQPINVKNDLTTSTTRNLYGAPKSAFITEYGGKLYAMNVDVNGVVYPDRWYQSSGRLGAITFVQGSQAQTTTNAVIKVDSVQYIKPGMVLDVYRAGTETRTYQNLTVISVNKDQRTITFLNNITTSSNQANAVAGTDTIELTSATNFPTGTPLVFTGGTAPTGLTSGTTYYAIAVDATHIKLATTYTNAVNGVAVDITAVGSGTATVYMGFLDNDEFWGAGRKNELAYYWNLDYPTTDRADFGFMLPGYTSDTEITAWAKGNNRIFFFTKNSMMRWDGSNPVMIFDDIGCPNIESIQNIGDWIIWQDNEGRIHARNDSTGQHNIISRSIRNGWLDQLTSTNIDAAKSGKVKNIYKIYVGTVNGENWRFCYDFDGNCWTREIHTKVMNHHLYSDMSGILRLYFMDNSGQMYLDEEGNTDDGTTIPFYIHFGRDNNGDERLKNYQGLIIRARNCAGTAVNIAFGENDMRPIGQLKERWNHIPIKTGQSAEGREYDLEITQNSEGDPVRIEYIATYFSNQEDRF